MTEAVGGRVQAVLIATAGRGQVVYERFYERFSDQERADIRAACAETSPEPTFAVARFRAGTLVSLLDNDLAYYAVGSGEYEELQLSEVLRVLVQSLREVLKKPPTEALLFENYARLCLVVDEILVEGLVENTDKDSVLAALKAKGGD